MEVKDCFEIPTWEGKFIKWLWDQQCDMGWTLGLKMLIISTRLTVIETLDANIDVQS